MTLNIFRRIKLLEHEIKLVNQKFACLNGHHKLNYVEGYNNGIPLTGRYIRGKVCEYCSVFIELQPVAKEKDLLS